MKFHIKTYGCQMNFYDSKKMSEELTSMNLVPTDDPRRSDIIIFNTCCVRKHAEDRALSEIGKFKSKEVIVTGCMAQKFGEKLKEKFPFISLVIGAKEIEKFKDIVRKYFNDKKFEVKTSKVSKKFNVSEYLSITIGCSNYCSYCIVPYVRGEIRCRNYDAIISEAERLIEGGAKEIVLLGQNVNEYNDNGKDLVDILEKLNEMEKLERIRFLTNHPADFSLKIIKTVANSRKVCKHIHLPLQSGSDKILKLMRRRYSSKQYIKLVESIRSIIPNISITTDLMVGFPGENEDDFQKTIEVVKIVQPDFAFVFKYSPREKTEAYQWKDDVPAQEKKRRHQILLDLCYSISTKKNSQLVGKNLEVLVEKKEKNHFIGKTSCNRTVIMPNTHLDLIGKLIKVKIVNSKVHSLIGEIN